MRKIKFREIKFRGRPLLRLNELRKLYIKGTSLIAGPLMSLSYCRQGIYFEKDDEDGYYPIFPDTLGQYTGMKDKNGKEIYEGDILRDNGGEITSVVWSDNYGAWMVEEPKRVIGELWLSVADGCEIIGNIYDNPELLE